MQKLIIGIAPRLSVELASDDIKQVIEQAAFWSSLPDRCPLCQSELIFFHRDPQDNDYWGMQCLGPVTHETNFGVYKTRQGLYYKGEAEWAKSFDAYQIKRANPGQAQQTAPQSSTAPPPLRQAANQNSTAPVEYPDNVIAQNLGELVTAKQLGMIRALSRELRFDPNEECNNVLKCRTDELSKGAASSFIKHLQEMQRPGEGGPQVPLAARVPATPPFDPDGDIPF